MQPIQVHLEIKREIGGKLSTLNVSLADLLVADEPPGILALLENYKKDYVGDDGTRPGKVESRDSRIKRLKDNAVQDAWIGVKSKAEGNHQKFENLYGALAQLKGTPPFGKYPKIHADIDKVIIAKMHEFYHVLSTIPARPPLLNETKLDDLIQRARSLKQHTDAVEQIQERIANLVRENEAEIIQALSMHAQEEGKKSNVFAAHSWRLYVVAFIFLIAVFLIGLALWKGVPPETLLRDILKPISFGAEKHS
jgi:hypothetical protein